MYDVLIKLADSRGETPSWILFVRDNFSEEQLKTFKHILASFPESLLIINKEYLNNDVISVLALIAYDTGNSRDLIKNLSISKSVTELFDSIESASNLAENNKILLVLMADTLNLPYIKDIAVEEQIAKLLTSKNTLLNSYNYIKNRGTLNTIEKVLTNYFLDANLPDVTFTITSAPMSDIPGDLDGNLNIFIDNSAYAASGETNYLMDFIGSIGTMDVYNVYNLKRSSDLFKLLMSVKPAGIKYNVFLMSSLAEILLYLNISDISVNYNTNEYTFILNNPNDVPVTVSIVDYDSDGAPTGLEVATVVNLNAGQTMTVTRVSDRGAAFSVDDAITKIQFTVTYEAVEPRVYIINHITDNPTILALASADFIVSKGSNIHGGYIDIRVTNRNNTAVNALLDIKWGSSPSSINTTFIVASNTTSTARRYINPYETIQSVVCKAKLTQLGYTDSPEIEVSIPNVVAYINDGPIVEPY